MKVTMKLHCNTHILIFNKRFLQMITQIRRSTKPILKSLLSAIELDTGSATRRNLWYIITLLDKFSVQDITIAEIDNISYCEVAEERQLRVELVEWLLPDREQECLDKDDLELLDWLCTDWLLITSLALSSNDVF